MLEYLIAVLYGVIEGITEWLPISSTGHMILFREFVPLSVSENFWSMFLVVIQLGAICAVLILFWNKIFPLQWKDKSSPLLSKEVLGLWGKILVACIPAAVVGILFDDVFDALFYHPLPIALALIVFGIAFLVIEMRHKGKEYPVKNLKDITYKAAIWIGVFQLLAAIFPGTSRSGATIIGALLLGISRSVAAEFTFVLSIPVMFGASLLKLMKYFLDGNVPTGNEIGLLVVGMIAAFAVSILVIRFLMDYVKKNDFKVFGWYRIILGLLVIVLLFF